MHFAHRGPRHASDRHPVPKSQPIAGAAGQAAKDWREAVSVRDAAPADIEAAREAVEKALKSYTDAV